MLPGRKRDDEVTGKLIKMSGRGLHVCVRCIVNKGEYEKWLR